MVRRNGPEEGSRATQLSNRTVDGIMIVDCNGRIVFGEDRQPARNAEQLITQNIALCLT